MFWEKAAHSVNDTILFVFKLFPILVLRAEFGFYLPKVFDLCMLLTYSIFKDKLKKHFVVFEYIFC